ncbi:glycosyltransferase family 2 protein [Lapidilactobacillus wuchangensis]|uniref:glycosyltransferase family 2 protein n=1 Tax=Lapidilactobacillus wuchangensis TaxID=2486001 RepID=UPI0013DE611C|nr:glycosyltransferase family 2 protein [Lapidilactobacillus wuchangensis]
MIKPKVAIIVLNYNNYSDTIECIKNIRKVNYSNYEIVVVDNHSTDNSRKHLEVALFANEVFLQASTNRGYAAGNNIGIKYALMNDADYLCILNNDVEVDPDFLTVLVDALEKNSQIGVAGPKICDFKNRREVQSAGAMVNMNYGRATDLYKGEDIDKISQSVISCDYVGGACMMIRASLVQSVGYIPENYFLFYEENEWCAKFKKHGYQIACITKATIWHKGSHTINQISGLSEYFMYRNLVIFVRRNGNLKNRLIFKLYFTAFCLKALLTKRNGKRFFSYFYDGLTGNNRYQYLQK